MVEAKNSVKFSNTLVSSKELHTALTEQSNNIRILNCSFNLSTICISKEVFDKERIPKASFFDPDVIADRSTNLPHMLPSLREFNAHMKTLDISNQDTILIYSDFHITGATRAWWMFKTFGINTYILEKGFNDYKKSGYPIEIGATTQTHRNLPESNYEFSFNKNLIKSKEETLQMACKILQSKEGYLIDARSAARFNSEVDEPRAGLRRGNIRGSINIFFKDYLDEDGAFKPAEDIVKLFKDKNVDISKDIIFYCGSGMTATVGYFASQLINSTGHHSFYDGSWADWGALPEPVYEITCFQEK